MNKKERSQIESSYTVIKNNGPWRHRLLIGTPSTGWYREEWVNGRFGAIIPTNWSHVTMTQSIPTLAPLHYLVADAQNIIVRHAIVNGFEWLLLLENDNIIMSDCFIRFNEYMRDKEVPIVSGLYFTKSDPPEPLVYRGRGNSFYKDWRMGDKVWVDGVPTGCLLVNVELLKAVWNESPEYRIGNELTRRVFNEVAEIIETPEGNLVRAGTSDLDFCDRVMKQGFFAKAGFKKYENKKFPFLIDTNIFTYHIDNNTGIIYPKGGIPREYMPKVKNGKQ